MNIQLNNYSNQTTFPKRSISIPVCYEGTFALDLSLLAHQKNLTVEEVIQIHTKTTYQVYMIGFLPGFAYMGKVDEQIQISRKEKPRTFVAAGSVGIAGEQTGIYPVDSPGGWQVIGKTPIKMFDIAQTNPCYLRPGDEVRFIPITLTEFQQISNS